MTQHRRHYDKSPPPEKQYRFGGWVAYEDEEIDWDRIAMEGFPLVLKRQEAAVEPYDWVSLAGCLGAIVAFVGFWGLAVWLFVR